MRIICPVASMATGGQSGGANTTMVERWTGTGQFILSLAYGEAKFGTR